MTFEILTILVLVNIGATISLWRLWRRGPRRPEELEKKFLKRVFDTKPITPKHQPPPPLKEGYAVGKKELQFFGDFAEFANVVNWRLGEHAHPWRLQELPEAALSLHDFEGPAYGRSYAIFHNQERLGTLEIRNGSGYSTERPRVITYVQLEYVRVLSFDTIRTFLTDIADHTCDLYENTKERFQAEQAIDRAMTEVLWWTSQVYWRGRPEFAEDYGEINLQLDGTATWYIGRRDCAAFQELKLKNKQ